jgi:hypothetical protein
MVEKKVEETQEEKLYNVYKTDGFEIRSAISEDEDGNEHDATENLCAKLIANKKLSNPGKEGEAKLFIIKTMKFSLAPYASKEWSKAMKEMLEHYEDAVESFYAYLFEKMAIELSKQKKLTE